MSTIHVYLRLTETVVIWYSQIRTIWHPPPPALSLNACTIICMEIINIGQKTNIHILLTRTLRNMKSDAVKTLLIANYPQWPPFCCDLIYTYKTLVYTLIMENSFAWTQSFTSSTCRITACSLQNFTFALKENKQTNKQKTFNHFL